MSKTKMLLDVVESMRSLADSIEVLSQGIADGDNRKQVWECRCLRRSRYNGLFFWDNSSLERFCIYIKSKFISMGSVRPTYKAP